MPEFLTTKELAALLRIKERKVYDLAASGDVPCSKATGKLLFPRQAIDAWLAAHSSGSSSSQTIEPAPNVFLGSHDPLLDWALRESQCGIASYFDGSADGLSRFSLNEGVATGLHLYEPVSKSWNVPAVALACGDKPVVLIEWARRSRGLIVRKELENSVRSLNDLEGLRIVPRQEKAGAQTLLAHIMQEAGLVDDAFSYIAPARSEQDAALAVREGKADAAFGLSACADQYQLSFVPLIDERFDLLISRHEWFEPSMQKFLKFCDSENFQTRARELPGYDISKLGQVHFNGPG